MADKAVAYIDLLGFSNSVKNNATEAIMMLTQFNAVLNTLSFERVVHPSMGYASSLQGLARRTSNESFEHFIPFSDSVFVASSNCSDFIMQLGHFVYSSFMFNAHVYAHPIDKFDPTVGHYIGLDDTGQSASLPCHEPPVLFRGGVAYGEVIETVPAGLFNNQKTTYGNLIGEAVVRAVKMEGAVKGPRIVFDKSVYDQLNDDAKIYCRVLPEEALNGYYEILWPAMGFVLENRETFIQEMNHFYDIFNPVYNLWKYYQTSDVADHYACFLELVVSSAIQVYNEMGDSDFINKQMANLINGRFAEDERVAIFGEGIN